LNRHLPTAELDEPSAEPLVGREQGRAFEHNETGGQANKAGEDVNGGLSVGAGSGSGAGRTMSKFLLADVETSIK
jgi:hypothetical protein